MSQNVMLSESSRTARPLLRAIGAIGVGYTLVVCGAGAAGSGTDKSSIEPPTAEVTQQRAATIETAQLKLAPRTTAAALAKPPAVATQASKKAWLPARYTTQDILHEWQEWGDSPDEMREY
jgi:hypothetical protein